MRSRLLLVFSFLTIILAVWAPPSRSLDEPHDSPNLPNVCETCHTLHNAFGSLLDPNVGDTINNLCMSCHYNGGPATEVVTHASAVNPLCGATCDFNFTSVCTDCHDPHSHDQPHDNPGSPGFPDGFVRDQIRVRTSGFVCTDPCPPGQRPDPVDGSCIADEVCGPASCPNGNYQCDASSGVAVCTCPIKFNAACTGCAPGYINYPTCSLDPCVVDGASCAGGRGLCGAGVGDCSPDCPGGQYNDPKNLGVCIPAATCGAGSCPGQATCDDSHGEIVCTCPVNFTGPSCDGCAPGYINYPTCSLDSCLTDGAVCAGGNGSCVQLPADCASPCPAGQYNDPKNSGTCTSDESCIAACPGNASCDNTHGEAVCTCPVGYADASCAASSCSAGFTGANCDPIDCTVDGTRCGYGDCANLPPTPGSEQQSCANNANQGAGNPCVSATCTGSQGDNANSVTSIGSDCYNFTNAGTTVITYTFETQSPSTQFNIWMRNICDASWETADGDGYNCTLDGVPWSIREEDGANLGGANCANACGNFADGIYCWMAGDADDNYGNGINSFTLGPGAHTLTCTGSQNDNGGNETIGFDGFIFTTDTAFVPQQSDGPGACGDSDATFTGGACAGLNWGPNVFVPPVVGGTVCTCDVGYVDGIGNCDTCDVGYVELDGSCILDPCNPNPCSNGGVCYMDDAGAAICDCPGVYFTNTCDQCACDVGCLPGEYTDPLTGNCIPIETCPGTCGANETCDNANGEAVCTCPVGYGDATCASSVCSAGFSGAACDADLCAVDGTRCGYGDCAGGAGTPDDEFQICSDDPSGQGGKCVSVNCTGDNGDDGAGVGASCQNGNQTLQVTIQHVFTTESVDGTPFEIWLRQREGSDGAQVWSCSLTGVNGGGTANFNWTLADLQGGTLGPRCAAATAVDDSCWGLLTWGGMINLDQGNHTLDCQVNVDGGFDGIIYGPSGFRVGSCLSDGIMG